MMSILLRNIGVAACFLTIVRCIDWPKDRALPNFPDVAQTVDVADLTHLSGEEQGLLTTLQGIVNRKQPRIYLYWNKTGDDPEGTIPSHQKWLQGIAAHVDVHDFSAAPLQLVDRYSSEIEGAILYDPDIKDTINIATTLAGMHNSVVANAELAKAHDLATILDLRGMFKSKLEAYEYALRNIYPKVTNRLITAISPTSTTQNMAAVWTNITQDTNHTMDASNNATYPIDLTPYLSNKSDGMVYLRIKDAFDGDGNGPTIYRILTLADNTTIADFSPGTSDEDAVLVDWGGSYLADYPWGHRTASGHAYIVYGFNPPKGTTVFSVNLTMYGQYDVAATMDMPVLTELNPVFRDYVVATNAPCVWLDPNNKDEVPLLAKILDLFEPNSAYLGWFPNGDEQSGVTQTAEKSIYVVAADYFFNGSLMSGLKKFFPISSKRKGQISTYSTPASKPIENKIYISMAWTEGDNIQYMQHRMRLLWDDPTRGQVPMGWTIDPLLTDLAPNMLNYFQTTATENDTLVIGPSGAGYTFPVNWPAQDLKLFLDQTYRYANFTGTGANIWVYNRINGTLIPLSLDIVAAYSEAMSPNLLGISADTARGAPNPYGVNITSSLPVAGLATIGGVDQGFERLTNISRDFFGNGSQPLFVACALYAWDTTPGNISLLVDKLPKETFEVVGVNEMYEMIRTFNKLP